MTLNDKQYLTGFGAAGWHMDNRPCPFECLEVAREYWERNDIWKEWNRGFVDGVLSGFGF